MTEINLPKRFDAENTNLGCWLKVPSSITAEIAARSGFDYICADMQHGFIDRSDLLPMLQAIQPHTKQVLVRVPSNEASTIGWALDAGATGVIVPLVNSASQAAEAIRSCQYPPKGIRSMGPTRATRVFGESYVDGVKESIQCLPMIETSEALENLDDILSVDGVNAIYVGPSDLSVNLGLPKGNNDGEREFDKALETIIKSCEIHNVVPGIHTNSSLAELREKQGFKILTVAEDDVAMQTEIRRVLAQLKP